MNGKSHREIYQSNSHVRVKYLLILLFCLLKNIISHAVKLCFHGKDIPCAVALQTAACASATLMSSENILNKREKNYYIEEKISK